jgi:hypothetical protein
MRQSYIPQGMDVGIDLGFRPVPGENGCMVGEQLLALEEICDAFEISSVSETPNGLRVSHVENLSQLSGDNIASCRLRGKHAAVL